MSIEAKKETREFQTEVSQLLDLMIHSLYSNKEIFLRELISNASDAADKLRFEALSDNDLYAGDGELQIRITVDKAARTITVHDNGIGMSREEVTEHLGTIAKSGTRQFFEALTGDQARDSQLIGQFGVGFYSSFIIADRVSVLSRRAGLPAEEGVYWDSTGEGQFTVKSVEKVERGTDVILHLREGEDDFLDGYRLRGIVRKYSDHISLPIVMKKDAPPAEGEDDAKEDEVAEDETVNSSTALWTMAKSEIKDEEYEEFYKHVSHDFEAPLAHIHSKVEGKTEYTSLLFIPKRAPFDLWDRGSRRGVKLYVRRVYIMDDAEQLMPTYLRFVRGVIDSNDLPLNISREILQKNPQIDSMRNGSVKKVLGLLSSLANNKPEDYAAFWKEFGRVLKEGIVEDAKNKDDLAKLLRFHSTRSEGDATDVSLTDYVSRMKDEQEHIYYVTADSVNTARNSPHLEIFTKKDIEVLFLTDEVDEWVVSHLTEFDAKKLQSVAKGQLDLSKLGEDENKEAKETAEKDLADVVKKVKDSLGEKVKEVRLTDRLTDSPACLVADDHDMGAHMERILKAAGQNLGSSKPILELNPEHSIVTRLKGIEDEKLNDWASLLYDQALLSEGGQLDDPGGFVKKMNQMFERLA